MSESTEQVCQVIDVTAGAQAPEGGRKLDTLLKTDALELKRLTLSQGAEIPEHHAPGPITVLCLSGRVRFSAGGDDHDLKAGALIALPARLPHALVAVEDSVVLVTKLAAP